MTDFTARQQPQQQPRYDFNDIFGCSAGRKRCAPGTNSTHPPAPNMDVAGSTVKQSRCSAAGRCPVCGVVLRAARRELESHLAWELERLYNDRTTGRRHDKSADNDDRMAVVHRRHHGHALPACSRDAAGAAGRLSPIAATGCRDASLHGRWETYQRVKVNRSNRLRIKYHKRKPDETLPAPCFCAVRSGPAAAVLQDQMNARVEMFVKNEDDPAAGSDDEDENVDVEGDTETSAYDAVYGGAGNGLWRGQQDPTRREPMVLLNGGAFDRGAVLVNYRTENPPSRQSMTRGDSTGRVDVLVVDDNDNNDLYKQNESNTMGTMDSCENSGPLDVSMKKENSQENECVKPKHMDSNKYIGQFNNDGQMVETLKARIRELESVSKSGGDKFTCLSCKGNSKEPVVSTSC